MKCCFVCTTKNASTKRVSEGGGLGKVWEKQKDSKSEVICNQYPKAGLQKCGKWLGCQSDLYWQVIYLNLTQKLSHL